MEGIPQPEQPRRIDFRHLRLITSLPDNVFLLRPDQGDQPPEPPEPEDIVA